LGACRGPLGWQASLVVAALCHAGTVGGAVEVRLRAPGRQECGRLKLKARTTAVVVRVQLWGRSVGQRDASLQRNAYVYESNDQESLSAPGEYCFTCAG
jgi:hypothetical protein